MTARRHLHLHESIFTLFIRYPGCGDVQRVILSVKVVRALTPTPHANHTGSVSVRCEVSTGRREGPLGGAGTAGLRGGGWSRAGHHLQPALMAPRYHYHLLPIRTESYARALDSGHLGSVCR